MHVVVFEGLGVRNEDSSAKQRSQSLQTTRRTIMVCCCRGRLSLDLADTSTIHVT